MPSMFQWNWSFGIRHAFTSKFFSIIYRSVLVLQHFRVKNHHMMFVWSYAQRTGYQRRLVVTCTVVNANLNAVHIQFVLHFIYIWIFLCFWTILYFLRIVFGKKVSRIFPSITHLSTYRLVFISSMLPRHHSFSTISIAMFVFYPKFYFAIWRSISKGWGD